MADSFTITCPSCGHEWQTLQVGRRARTCPKCGHVGPREAFPERLTQAAKGDDDVTRSKDATKGGGPGDAPAGAQRTNGEPKEVHRPLVGAALAAHEAKKRGERVQVPARSSSRREDRGDRRNVDGRSRTATPASSRAPGLLERVRRIW